MSISLLVLLWVCAPVYSRAIFAIITDRVPIIYIIQSLLLAPFTALIWSILALDRLGGSVIVWNRK